MSHSAENPKRDPLGSKNVFSEVEVRENLKEYFDEIKKFEFRKNVTQC